MQAIRIFIRGIVQGVGYRFFTERVARSLQLRGFVRNLPDGRVEAVAAGREEDLETFIARLREGPSAGRVDGIETSRAKLDDAAEGFEIRS